MTDIKRLACFLLLLLVFASCGQEKKPTAEKIEEEVEVNDSTLYGVCGRATRGHRLQLITNMRDTLKIQINDEQSEEMTLVLGGLMAGDRMAVTARKTENGMLAQRIVNITSLIGCWKSIDKNFEITEDGAVNSFQKDESSPWTAWRILNGQLLMNRDTFDITKLSADSLEIESRTGIYFYKRIKPEILEAKKDSLATDW